MLSAIDVKLFYLINKGCSNHLFDIIMPFITMLGSGESVFAISFLLLFLKKKKHRMAGIVILAALSVAYYVVSFLKGCAARPRPFMALPDVQVFGRDGGYSFPSGHAAIAFLAATVLSRYFKGYAVFFTLALLVCYSRVYLGVHYVSDVTAGAIIGSAIGYGLAKAVEEQDL